MSKNYSSVYHNQPNHYIESVQTWKSILEDPVSNLGCSIFGFERKIDNTVKELNDIADALDTLYFKVGISKATGGLVSVAGSAMALTGLYLAPVTFGASVGLTIGGMALSTAGGLGTVGVSLVQFFTDKNKIKKAKELHHEVTQLIVIFTNVLTQYMNALDKFHQYLIEKEKNMQFTERFKVMSGLNGVRKIVSTPVTVANNVSKVFTHFNEIPPLTVVTETCSLDAIKVIGSASTQLADEIAAPGIRIGSKIFLKASGTGAKVLSASVSGIGIGMGLWDIVNGALDMSNGSQNAKEFRKDADGLCHSKQEILRLYRNFVY